MRTFDQMTIDSTGAFLIGELERLDPTLNMPLVAYTWSRDIDLREDVSIADENSSFTNSSFAAVGGINPNGKNWIGKDSKAIAGLALDIGKTLSPLFPWGMELGWTLLELASAQQVGRPVDMQKYDGMQMKWNMDIDEMVYIGDSGLGKYGLINSTSVITSGNVAAGAGGLRTWVSKTPAEIMQDVNTLCNAVYAASGWAVCPRDLLLPPTNFAYIAGQDVGIAGYRSILEWLKANSLSNAINGVPLNIKPCKWCETGATTTGLSYQRMVAYTKDKKYVRFPMVPMQRTPLEFRSIWQLVTYYARLGVVEMVYPETIGYADGI